MKKARASLRNLDKPILTSWGNKLAKAAYRIEWGEGGQNEVLYREVARAEIQCGEKTNEQDKKKKATTPSLTPAPARYTMQFLPFVCAVETRWSADRNNRETVDTTRREKDWFSDATVGPAGNSPGMVPAVV